MAMNWKVAAAGGAVLGLGVGGFVLTDDDSAEFQQVRDVDLQSARDAISSLSSPIRVTPPTTVQDASVSPTPAPAPAPAPASVSAPSADTPVPAPAPAPAPTYDSASASSPVQPPSADSASSFSAASAASGASS